MLSDLDKSREDLTELLLSFFCIIHLGRSRFSDATLEIFKGGTSSMVSLWWTSDWFSRCAAILLPSSPTFDAFLAYNDWYLLNQNSKVLMEYCFVCLFDLILYYPVNNLSVKSGPVFLCWTSTKLGLMCLVQRHNTVTPVRLKPTALQSQVKHSTTEPLRSPDDGILRPYRHTRSYKHSENFYILTS